jgi:hypothetical protein
MKNKDLIKHEARKFGKAVARHKHEIIKEAIENQKIRLPKAFPTPPKVNISFKNGTNSMNNFAKITKEINKIKENIIGKVLNNCKKGEPCLIESSIYIDYKTKKPITKLYLLSKNAKKGDIIYESHIKQEMKDFNTLCNLFFKTISTFKLTPEKLAKFLEQKHNTEKILNS